MDFLLVIRTSLLQHIFFFSANMTVVIFYERREDLNVGLKIKEVRENKRMTQEELADAINVEQSFISKIENGVRIPTFPIMVLIAIALGVSLDEFK